MHLLVYLHMVH